MKTKISQILLFALVCFFCFTSCQDEVVEVDTISEQETIIPNSTLSNLMVRASSNDGSADDVLDDSSCFSIELPVTIILSDAVIVIESQNDLANLNGILQDFLNNGGALDFVFPITIIFNDYSEFVIENQEHFANYINDCSSTQNNIIDCADFVYPISFSVFNSDFNIIDTIVVENDYDLYMFLDALEADDNALVVSLNYPVTLLYGNGETVEVTSNQELTEAIEAASSNCEDDTVACSQEDVFMSLVQCAWDFTDGTDAYDNYQMVFGQNGDLLIPEGLATSAIGGAWNLSLSNNGLPEIVISDLTAFSEDLEGSWIVTQCSVDGQLTLMQGDVILELEQDCFDPTEVFNCFGDFELVECASANNIPVYNLAAGTIGLVDCAGSFTPSFHITLVDAENNTNAIPNIESYETLEAQVFLRIEVQNGEFQVFNVYLNTEDCNLFECFQSFEAVYELCDEGNDGIETFDLTVVFSNCTPTADVVTYHETVVDADTNTNAIVNPQAYTNYTNPQTVYVRVEINNQYEVFPIQLLLQNCNSTGCSETDIDAYLIDCIWNAVNYNGSDNLMDYNFDFNADGQTVTISNSEITIAAFWSTSQSDEGVIIEFNNVAGPNIQAITGSWLVVECNEERLEMNRGSDLLVLEKTCN